MNRTAHSYSKRFSTALLTSVFFVASTMPALASPQQASTEQPSQSTSSSTTQQPDNSLPEAPQAQSDQSQSTPSGAAGAKAAPVKGAPVAQPAGAAVAPVKQRGHRSLLIKIGLIAGAGAAIGTVVALSAGSSSRPPGVASAR